MEIDSDYNQLSMIDFDNSHIEFSIGFGLPTLMTVGQQMNHSYISERDFIDLVDINSVRIAFDGYKQIEISDIQKTGKSIFTGKFSLN